MRLRFVQSRSLRGFGATVTPYGRPTLKQGDRGPDVADLQEMLNGAIGTDLAMDGVFGPATADAVRRLQTQQHLLADGVVSIDTWAALGQPASGQAQVSVVGVVPKAKSTPAASTNAPGVLNQVQGFLSDPVNLAAIVAGGALIAYFALRK